MHRGEVVIAHCGGSTPETRSHGVLARIQNRCRCAASASIPSPETQLPEPRMRYFRYSDRFIRPSSQTTIEATVSLP